MLSGFGDGRIGLAKCLDSVAKRVGDYHGIVNQKRSFGTETAFVPLADAEQKFESAGITKDKRVIAYCGGGISATVDLFLLHRLGYQNLTLYDGSMGEWAKDASLPIETD